MRWFLVGILVALSFPADAADVEISCPNLRGDLEGHAIPREVEDKCFADGAALRSCDYVARCRVKYVNAALFARIGRALGDPHSYCDDAPQRIHWPPDTCVRSELQFADQVYGNLFLFSNSLLDRCLDAARSDFRHYAAMMQCLTDGKRKELAP